MSLNVKKIIEDMVKEKKRGSKKKLEKLNEIIKKPAGKIKIVPASNPAPAIQTFTAIEPQVDPLA